MLYTRSLAAAAACTLAITGAATANLTTATYVGDNGIEGMGTFVASVTYDYSGGPSASLTIAIDHTHPAPLDAFREFKEPVRGAVRTHDAALVGHSEALQGVCGVLHRLPVALGPHDD